MATELQERAIAIMAENGRKASPAMIQAGYSPASATRPSKLTRSKGFQELLEKYLPERHLLKKHSEFLNAKRITRTYQRGDLKDVTEETDPNAVRALDMAYKLKGKYKQEGGNNVLIINVSGQTQARYAQTVTTPLTEDGVIDSAHA